VDGLGGGAARRTVIDGDRWEDSTGICGVAGHPLAAQLVGQGLAALPHRGALLSGACFVDGRAQAFEAPAQHPAGTLALGRSARTVGSVYRGRVRGADMAIALSGRVQNSGSLWRDLEGRGAVCTVGHDAELLAHGIAHSAQRTFVNRLVDALWKMEGAFSALLAAEGKLVAVRDARGFRPLVVGRVGSAYVFASDRSAVDAMGGAFLRDVEPGEMLIVDADAMRSVAPFARRSRTACVQELLALQPNAQECFGTSVYAVRVALGERLGKDQPVARAQVVVPLDAGAFAMAAGFARAARVPFEPALEASAVIARVPEASSLGFSAARAAVDERRVVLVASALLSGVAVRAAVAALREAGAREVQVRVASPPVKALCVYGVDTPGVDAVPATDVVALATRIGADGLAFLDREAALEELARTPAAGGWCEGCWTGTYPVPPEVDGQLPLFSASA
jgi:amidophosphoribosyltransferase